MGKSKQQAAGGGDAYDEAFSLLHETLTGDARAEIVDGAARTGDFREALRRLRSGMRSHSFRTASGPLAFGAALRGLDLRTRQEGFHVLHAWDPQTHRFTTETNPVLMVDYLSRTCPTLRPERATLALFLDCYFLFLVSLLAMRAWDRESPDAALGAVTALIGELQGGKGSGHRFVADAETLLLLATSQYQPEEPAYDRLLERVRTLGEGHRLRLARVGAPNLGSHLRWGFQRMYRAEPERMRADNVVDYPWLLFSLATLMGEYLRMRDAGVEGEAREEVVGALLNGFTADPWAFVAEAPACLAEHREEHAFLAAALHRHRDDLLAEFDAHRPVERRYSPLAFQFNFLHNTLVAKLAVALTLERAPNLPLNALFEREPAGTSVAESPELLARMLMDWSGGDPGRLGARGSVLVVYDPGSAARGFAAAEQTLRELA